MNKLLLLLFLCSPVSAFGQVTISPSTLAVVNQGQAVAFTATVAGGGGVTWSCPGCAGSINASTGVYTAPSTISAKDSFGGYQLLPNDHIFNTPINSLPLNSNSTTWIAAAGTVPVNYLPSFDFNYVNGSTPTTSEVFLYTPSNNGTFQVPAYPSAKVEGGWLYMLASPFAVDHHLWTINTANGTFQELYRLSTPAQCNAYAGGTPNCTAESGLSYSNSTYALPSDNSTDAAGLYLMPLSLHYQELMNAIATHGTINHALRFTLQNAYICGSSVANACGGNASGTRHIWPATSEAFAGSGVVPYGARFRLKSSVNISNFSPIARILLTQLQQYGIILADGGYGWQITIDNAKWPADVVSAFNEIANADIPTSDFEAVDESSLEVSSSSGATTNSETIVATSVSSPPRNCKTTSRADWRDSWVRQGFSLHPGWRFCGSNQRISKRIIEYGCFVLDESGGRHVERGWTLYFTSKLLNRAEHDHYGDELGKLQRCGNYPSNSLS